MNSPIYKGDRVRMVANLRVSLALPLLLQITISMTGCGWLMYRGNPGRTGQSSINTSLDTGALEWSISSPGFATLIDVPSGPIVWSGPGSGPTIYAAGTDGKLYAFNSDSSLKWTYEVQAGPSINVAAVTTDGSTIYVTTGNLYAVSSSGSLKWTFVPPGPGIPFEPAIGADGTVYFGDQCGDMFALTPSGSIKWEYTGYSSPNCSNGGGNPIGPPAIANDGTIYFPAASGVLVALTPSGSVKWTAGFVGQLAVSTAGTIYIEDGYHLTALNPDSTLKWQINVLDYISAPAIGSDGTIYIGSLSGLLAINPDSTLKWQFRSDLTFTTATISGDGTIYAPVIGGGAAKVLYAINADGTPKWSRDWSSVTSCSVQDNEPAIGPDGTIYIIPDNGGQCMGGAPLIAIH